MFEDKNAHVTGSHMMKRDTVWATVDEVSRLRSRVLNLEEEIKELKLRLDSSKEQ